MYSDNVFHRLSNSKIDGCEQIMPNIQELLWHTTARLLEDLLGSCTKLVLGALRVSGASSLMCKLPLG